MSEVAKFKAQNSSNMHNDSVLNVGLYENTPIPKSLVVSKQTSISGFSVFLKNLGFGFLTVTETTLWLLASIANLAGVQPADDLVTHAENLLSVVIWDLIFQLVLEDDIHVEHTSLESVRRLVVKPLLVNLRLVHRGVEHRIFNLLFLQTAYYVKNLITICYKNSNLFLEEP